MKFDTSVYVGVNQTALSKGVLVPLIIDFKNTPHMILVPLLEEEKLTRLSIY